MLNFPLNLFIKLQNSIKLFVALILFPLRHNSLYPSKLNFILSLLLISFFFSCNIVGSILSCVVLLLVFVSIPSYPLALTGFAPVSSGSKPDILDYYTIGLREITLCFPIRSLPY